MTAIPMRPKMAHKLDVFTFGKHRGKTVRWVIDNDPSYILWCGENKICEFSQEILDNAEDADIPNDGWHEEPGTYGDF